MKLNFHYRFEEELLRSEKSRTTILTAIFSFAIIYSAIIIIFFSDSVSDILNLKSLYTILYLQVAIVLFELSSLIYIVRRIGSSKKHLPVLFQYLNSSLEISFPTALMYFLSIHFDEPGNVLNSPAASICFVFIILSTLRLNPKLSLYTGLLAACQYLGFAIYLIRHCNFDSHPISSVEHYFPHVARSLVILLSGIASGFVSKQIRTNITRTLTEAEQKTQVVNLFRQQVSSTVVDDMLEKNGSMKSKRMNVGVMFIDIRDFTKYVADKSPEEIVNYQNSFFKIIIDCVTKYDGIINQFLGDGCMATFGAPISLENPGQNAIEAALEIKHRISLAVEDQKLPPTQIGVGIHTGEAVTGNIGNEVRQQYSITGGVVILAARIEQLNKEYQSQILISEEVMKNADSRLVNRSVNLGPISLKGWDQPVGIYKLA